MNLRLIAISVLGVFSLFKYSLSIARVKEIIIFDPMVLKYGSATESITANTISKNGCSTLHLYHKLPASEMFG